MKRILFFLCLLSASLTSAFANTVYDIIEELSGSTTSWGVGTVTTTDGTVTIPFTDSWGTYGWVDWYTDDGGLVDLTPYDYVIMSYTVSGSYPATFILDSETPTGEYVTSKEWSDDAQDSVEVSNQVYTSKSVSYDLPIGSGTIKCSVDSLAKKLDLYYFHHFYIVPNVPDGAQSVPNPCTTVTVTSLKLVKVTPIISGAKTDTNDVLNLAWEETQDWGEESGSIAVGTYNDDYSAKSATLTFSSPSGEGMDGLGWSYYSGGGTDLLDLSGYSQIVVHYEVTSGDSPTIDLYVQDWDTSKAGTDGYEPNSTGNITGSSGVITCDIEEYSSVDFSKIGQITIEADAACTITVDSIELISSTINTPVANFIKEDSGTYSLNLNVTKNGTWAGRVYDTANSDEDIITSSQIAFTKAEELVGYEYTSSDQGGKHLNISSYTPTGGGSVDFSQLEVTYNISYENRPVHEKLRIMLELLDKDSKNIEVYDTCCIGRIRVNFSNYNKTSANSDIDFTNIQKVIFMVESLADTTTLNIQSIRLLTAQQVADEVGKEHNLLISQMYIWDDNDVTTITPVTYDATDYPWASTETDQSAIIKTKCNWTAATWWVDNVSEEQYWGVELKVRANRNVVARLTNEYRNSDNGFTQEISVRGETGGDEPTETQTLILPFLKNSANYYNKNLTDVLESGTTELDQDLNEIYLLWGLIDGTSDKEVENEATIEIVSAKLLKSDAYSEDFVIITINSDDGYGTYYNSEKNYRMPYGMSGTTITGIENIDDESGEHTTYGIKTGWKFNDATTFDGGNLVPAGTPLLILGNCDDNTILTYTAFEVKSTDSGNDSELSAANAKLTDGNLLQGTDEPIEAETMLSKTATYFDVSSDEAASDYYYYKLAYPGYDESTGRWTGDIGFYWGAEKGAAFAMQAYNHAWLTLEQSKFDSDDDADGVKISGLTNDDESVDGDDTTTGITVVPATISNGAIYNLQGVRVNDMSGKGIYIVDGKKIVKQ